MSRVIVKIIKFLPSLLIITICMPIFVVSTREIGKYLGYLSIPVNVLGTGSMYPSLYWDKSEGGPDDANTAVIDESRTTPKLYRNFKGISFLGNNYLNSHISYGDMVAFTNSKTVEILSKEQKNTDAGFIKRVIGVPGDLIELRDGYVKKNGQLLDEPYINKPRSTYADSSIAECHPFTIPPGEFLVMGDNRKVSSDSRGELGLVNESDIKFYLPYDQQEIYKPLWRNTSSDASLAGTPTLNRQDFYKLLNQERVKRGLSILQIDKKLELSSTLRAQNSLRGNEQYNMSQAFSNAGYQNIITSEFSIRGRFTAEELMQNLLYFPDTAKRILDPELDEVGVSDVSLEVNGCPTDMIVGHLGGYRPADYSQDTIDSWKSLRDSLIEILPSWERAVEYEGIDKAKLSELLTIYRRRLALASEIFNTMDKREWLSKDQEARIQVDEQDAKKSEQLAKDLNGEK